MTGICYSDAITTRTILNKPATIRLQSGQYFIVEQGTIDTKLLPCNLSAEFQIDNLPVTISGEVKATAQNAFYPCCIEHFIILKIK